MLHRNNDLFPDETAVENTIFQTVQQQKNISFLLSSSQNIDRIVSAYLACKHAGKLLVIDIYTAWVLEQLRQITRNTPAMDWAEIKVFAIHSQDERLKANPDYFGDFRKRLYGHRVKREELHATPESFLYFGKMSSFRLIDEFKNAAAPVNVIYSQWLSVILVYAFDRLATTLQNFLALVDEIDSLGIELISVKEAVDTSTPTGRMFVTTLGSIAQMQKSFTKERIKAGMRRRKLDGLPCGRQPLDIDHDDLVRDRLSGMSLTDVAKRYGVSRASVVRWVREAQPTNPALSTSYQLNREFREEVAA